MAKKCLQIKLEGASLQCSNEDCEQNMIIHVACSTGVRKAIKRIPKLKSSNPLVQKAANEGLIEMQERVITKFKTNWLCSMCNQKSKQKVFRVGKRKSSRLSTTTG